MSVHDGDYIDKFQNKYVTDITDIQPMIGQTLGNVRELFEQLCRQYGSDAVLSNICYDGNYSCVEVEVPIGN